MRTTDMADELFSGAAQPLPAGVRLATARHGGVTVTRVEIAREGLSRPRGRYVTLEMPSVSVLDERDAAADTLAYLEENPKDIDNATKDAFLYYRDLHMKRQS